MLQPFSYIDEAMVENGVGECFKNGTMYCMRLQVVSNRLYITDYRAVFFDRHYAPARVMPMLDVLRRHKIPDVDLVVAAVDEPRVKTKVDLREWTATVQKYHGGASCVAGGGPAPSTSVASLPPPLFSSTVNRAHLDLAWPDFSFYMPRKPHKLRTPPWSSLHPQMLTQSARLSWDTKTPLAVHTGNVGSPFRKRLAEEARRSPGEMLVNELFIGDHGKIRQTCAQLGLHLRGGFQQHKCYMTFEEQCSYKYLLNSASIGYANKFKYLLLCGSVVIYVREGMAHKEFYEYGLLPGVHYVAVDRASDVPAMVRWLKQHDDYARAVAMAGRARMAMLNVDAVADFMAELLTQYARKQTFRVRQGRGAIEIACEDDLWRHYAREYARTSSNPVLHWQRKRAATPGSYSWLLESRASSCVGSPGWMHHYLMEDNATCIRPLSGAALGPPGYGGAYAGSKPRCVASHDLRQIAQPDACSDRDGKGPHQAGESFEPFDAFPYSSPRDNYDWVKLRFQPRGRGR